MSLRRSQRGRRQEFHVGDVVEVLDSARSGVTTCCLLRKLRDSKADNIRWIVAFDSKNRPNEEVPEKSFGKLVKRASASNKRSQDMLSSASSNGDETKRQKRGLRGRKLSAATTSDTSTLECTKNLPLQSNKGKGIIGVEGKASKTHSSLKNRKRRRENEGKLEKRITTRSAARNGNHNEMIGGGLDALTKGRFKKSYGGRGRKKLRPDEEVVKVKMLTGILYLYRGDNRRAEFVRFF